MISSKGDRLNLRMLVRLSRKADKTQIFSHKDSSCCREEAFLVDEEQLAGKLDCFPHLPQIPESCSGSPHHPGAGSFSWCRILPPPWCISARTPPPALGRHHQTLHHLPPPFCCWCMPNMHNYQETCPPSARPCLSFAAQFFTRFPAFTAAQADMRGMRGMRRGPLIEVQP